jgi:hypothetical protein
VEVTSSGDARATVSSIEMCDQGTACSHQELWRR